MDEIEKAKAEDTAEYVRSDLAVSRFYEVDPIGRAEVEVAAKSHPGKVRENNEDNYLAVCRYRGRRVLHTSLPEEILEQKEDHAYTLAVADGMGGCNFGELASLLAMRTGWELGGGEIKWPMKVNEREDKELQQKAETFFKLIDDTLHAAVREFPRLTGMGTTLTICYSIGPELYVLHAGDSRAYVYRDGSLLRLTRDHTVAQVLLDSGMVQPDSREVKRMKHVLTNVLGGPDTPVTVDVNHHRLQDGDLVLLCTDGLTDMVPEPEILELLSRHPKIADASDALVELALEKGGNDNVTVLLARYRIDESPPGAERLRAFLPK